MNITLKTFLNLMKSYSSATVKDPDGNIIYEDLQDSDDTIDQLASNYQDLLVESFSINQYGRLLIELEKPVETINFSTDVEYILRSEKRTYDWLNIQGTIESSDNQKQKMLTFLQSLDDNDQALVKFVGMVCTCDKNLLDGGNKNV